MLSLCCDNVVTDLCTVNKENWVDVIIIIIIIIILWHFLKRIIIVKGYTRLDKIRNEVTKKNRSSLEYKVWNPNTNKTGSTILKGWTTPDWRNTPSNVNLEEEEIVDALRNDGNASMAEQFKRPNPWKIIIIIIIIIISRFESKQFPMADY